MTKQNFFERNFRRMAAAWLVLGISLCCALFAWWRVYSYVEQRNTERFTAEVKVVMEIINQHFSRSISDLRNSGQTTLREPHVSDAGWEDFLDGSEWRSRNPGFVEVGLIELQRAAEGPPRFVLRHLKSMISNSVHAVGREIDSSSKDFSALTNAVSIGGPYGTETLVNLTSAESALHYTVVFIPMPTGILLRRNFSENSQRMENILMVSIDQEARFAAIQPRLQQTKAAVELLPPDSTKQRIAKLERVIGLGGVSGGWKFRVTPAPSFFKDSQLQLPWLVLAGGLCVSALLFCLVWAQGRRRLEAEEANVAIREFNQTLEKRIEERTVQLQNALVEEKELNTLKSNFISMVSHEIRTPLALILSSSDILNRYLDRLPVEKRQRHLQTIDESVKRMALLVEDVLLFSRAEAGRLEFKPAPLNLNEFCHRIADEVESATNRKSRIRLLLPASAENIRVDEGLVRHILTNLLANAVKYSKPDSNVSLELILPEREVLFRVRDEGIGIPAADLKHLFTPFCRGNNVTSIPGTGLGLAIVKRCIERHGGKIEIQSVEGQGTTVIVRLPVYSPGDTEAFQKQQIT